MTTLHEIKLELTEGQIKKVKTAINKKVAVSLQFAASEVGKGMTVMLPQRTVNKLKSNKSKGVGTRIKISNPKKSFAKSGAGILDSVAAFAPKLLSAGSKLLPGVLKSLGQGALSAIGSLGINELFGSGFKQGINLPALSHLLKQLEKNKTTRDLGTLKLFTGKGTAKEKYNVLALLHALDPSGKAMLKEIIKEQFGTLGSGQRGGFLGTLAATLGIPLLLKVIPKLFGGGIKKKGGTARRVDPNPWFFPKDWQKRIGGSVWTDLGYKPHGAQWPWERI